MVSVLAVPNYNEYDQEYSKVGKINRDHWSTLNPQIQTPTFSREIQRLWESFLVGTNQSNSAYCTYLFTLIGSPSLVDWTSR